VTRIWSELIIGVVGALIAFALFYVNMRVARSMAPRAVLTSVGDLPPQLEEVVIAMRAKMGPYLDKALLWGSVGFAIVLGASLADEWQTLRLALASVPFGLTDPQFGRDVGFYVFTLPALRVVGNWLPSVLVLTLIATIAVHLIDGAIQPAARFKGFAPHVKAHLSVLLGLIVASKAFDYWLRVWELNFSPRGQVAGASYTDVHAQLPALRILIAIALISAFILLVNIRFQGWRLPAIALGIWVGASILVGGLYPAIVQRFVVSPNESQAEAPYIERNIAATRKAFGLDEIETRAFPAAETLTAQDVIDNTDTLENVSPVNSADTRGLPEFLIGDIPPKSTADVTLTQPAIYFGEDTTDYVIVNTGINEFDYPKGDENAETTYSGKAGIKVGSLATRILFAMRFGASQILFSDYIDSNSRVLYARDVGTRGPTTTPIPSRPTGVRSTTCATP